MKTKFLLTVFIVFTLTVSFAWSTGGVSADSACDSAYVTQTGAMFTVKPTGVDDTENLQCAFDEAIALGAGMKVQLSSGTFHTAQIVVNGFNGQFSGEGMDNSVVMNLPNLYVTPVDFYFNPPSTDNPWPSLFVFVEGDFIVSDLAIHISGEDGTTGWTIFGIDPPITELAHGIAILGPHADARFERLLVEGEPADNSLLGYNLINGIFYEGFVGEVPPPISGYFHVVDSIFRQVGSGTPIYNLNNAKVFVSKNTFDDVFLGMDGGDLVNSSLEFSYNEVSAFIGLDIYNLDLIEDVGSTILIKNNRFQGVIGPILEQTLGDGNYCLLKGNNVQNVIDIGILLGEGIHGCTVVGGSNKTNVLDLGTNNVLVGVNNMETGVGPTIQHFMKP